MDFYQLTDSHFLPLKHLAIKYKIFSKFYGFLVRSESSLSYEISEKTIFLIEILN